MNSLSIQSKTPVRSSLDSTKQALDIQIDKSSDLVNIKNGYFSYNGKMGGNSSSNDPNNIVKNIIKNNSIRSSQRSPRIIVNTKNCIEKSPKGGIV